jgi:hypothetical protein
VAGPILTSTIPFDQLNFVAQEARHQFNNWTKSRNTQNDSSPADGGVDLDNNGGGIV